MKTVYRYQEFIDCIETCSMDENGVIYDMFGKPVSEWETGLGEFGTEEEAEVQQFRHRYRLKLKERDSAAEVLNKLDAELKNMIKRYQHIVDKYPEELI